MTIRLSTGARNGLLGTMGFKELFNGGIIKVYSGSQPASADYVETGTLLVTFGTSGSTGLVFGTAATGSVPKSADTWSAVVAVTGVAGWFRFHGTAGTTGTSATEVRMDGNVGVSGADMTLSNTSLTAGATLTIDTATLTEPASS